jgi:hypothetical protein
MPMPSPVGPKFCLSITEILELLLCASQSSTPLNAMKTQWKDIPAVPTSQEFLDIVLSRTQRRLPTQVSADRNKTTVKLILT